ncbi:MAG: GCN5-related N-acetyltransferase [Gemmatimonadetes bacterium]|nr:GCN5-related N-acetyltransferase [Gemmatimonadota bacterium]
MKSLDRLSIVVDLEPQAEDVALVRAGLMSYNESQVGPADVQRLAFYLRDGQDGIRGGLVGFLAFQWLSVELLWVDDALRGQGYGSSLLSQAEKHAREAGCVGARLDTYEFQAKPFYEKLGYAVFGVLEGYPANTRTYYLQKALR